MIKILFQGLSTFQAQMTKLAVHTTYSSSVHPRPSRKQECRVKTGDMATWAEVHNMCTQRCWGKGGG